MGIKKKDIIQDTLFALHHDARKDLRRIGKGVVKSLFRPMQPADFEHAYLPISQSQGVSIRNLIIENDCKNIVEFGTSFGISTIYLADAAYQVGGNVITTELLESKALRARKNIAEAGLSEYVEVIIGDAIETLSSHSAPIDFLLLDGWKDLYLPLFQMLEPLFRKNTLIYADNMDMAGTEAYAGYLAQNHSKYFSQLIDGGKAFLTKIAKEL